MIFRLLQTSSCLIKEQRERGKKEYISFFVRGAQKITCWSGLIPSIYQNMPIMEKNNKICLVFILHCLGL